VPEAEHHVGYVVEPVAALVRDQHSEVLMFEHLIQ
jgi:hypothetical protein